MVWYHLTNFVRVETKIIKYIYFMDYKTYNSKSVVAYTEKQTIINFLYEYLEEYGDSKEDISKCLDYALSEESSKGGLVLMGYEENELAGIVLMNNTGMEGYIPENILVYIAVNRKFRGKGLGKELIKKVMDLTDGDIKLHVEPQNPARFLYEKVGFENKYLEYRLKQNK